MHTPMSDDTPLLELQGIRHRFGANVALDDASFTLRRGTVHALLGENGAGKTTLMRVAFGMIAPDAGAISIGGRPAALHRPADAIARGIGMVHQHFSLVPELTVAENVALGGHGLFDRARVGEAVHALGRECGLVVDPAAPAGSLGIVQQQRLEILKALYRKVRILILDEPTAVLAPAETDELLAWLRAFAARGNAVVLITHKLREAQAVADDVTVLRRGVVAARGSGQEATTGWLTRAMLGDAAMPPDTEGAVAVMRGPAARGASGERVPVVIADGITAAQGRERIAAATFTLHAGEVVGIAGVEGSGQHLLLRLLAGRARTARGSLTLPDAIGFIPEDRHREAIVGGFSLAENVAVSRALRHRGLMNWNAWRGRARSLVEAHDVRGAGHASSPGDVPIDALSGGNQQKLVVARELADDPALVVAENPTRGLDVRAAAAVQAQLCAAADRGAAVVVYSADLDEVIALADRVLVVHDGHVHEVARDRDAVGRAMLGVP